LLLLAHLAKENIVVWIFHAGPVALIAKGHVEVAGNLNYFQDNFSLFVGRRVHLCDFFPYRVNQILGEYHTDAQNLTASVVLLRAWTVDNEWKLQTAQDLTMTLLGIARPDHP
jgi:hypothetical protein